MNRKRGFEILIGVTSWNLIFFLVWGGYFFPTVTAYFILAFVVYWVYRGFSWTLAAVVSHFQIKAAQKLDWMNEVKGFGDWSRVKHLVIVLISSEPVETYVRTLEALANQT